MGNSAAPPRVSVVINFYNPNDVPRVTAMVLFCLESVAAYTVYPLELILVDGSGKITDAVAETCSKRGWIYLQCPHKGAFARIYNQGMEAATGDYRVWMASDIFVTSGWEQKLIAEMQRTGAMMAAPYLTNSDYPGQVFNWVVKMKTFAPSSLTFNLNMITADCFKEIGGMDDRFTGNFNDLDYLVRIRKAGKEVIIVDCGQIAHMARATSSVASTFNWDQDRDRFVEKYPELALKKFSRDDKGWRTYDLRSPLLSRSHIYKALVSAGYALPASSIMCNRLIRTAMRLEPFLHRV
jgi:GT2 family glycosyltransferase